MNILSVKNLDLWYNQNSQALKDVNIDIEENTITALIGPSGCGKSTFLKTVARILPAKRGDIKINGTNIKKHASKELAKQMAVLPQSPKVPNGLLVKELV